MSNSLDVIVHCFAAQLPQYAAMLRVQARSLVKHAPDGSRIKLVVAVAAPEHDEPTWAALREIIADRTMLTFAGGTDHVLYLSEQVSLHIAVLPREQLFRRAIFRHRWLTRYSAADAVWLADCDYSVGPGSIEAILAQVQNETRLVFPKHYWIHSDHAAGDRAWQAVLAGQDFVELSDFKQIEAKVALGGMQILGGSTAKRVGYLGDSKWQRPADSERPFACFFDDSVWRRKHFRDAQPIEIPNLYRMRHSVGSTGSPGPAGSVDAH